MKFHLGKDTSSSIIDVAIMKLQLVNYCEVVNGRLFEIGHSFIPDMDECGS